MGVFAAMTAEPSLYEFEGVSYKVSPWTVEVIAAFERYVEKRAHDAFDRISGRLPAAAAERALSALMQDITAGVYTFGTPFMGKALQAPEHVGHMWFLCLNKMNGSVDKQLAKRMVEADYDGVIAAMNEANQDPNLRAPAAATPPATTPPPTA